MAFNPSSFLLDLSPTKGIGIGDIAQISAQRQQMKLAREKFEFDKKQAEEEKRLRELEEQGRAARAAMEAEQERARAERERQATLLAKQQEGLMKFGEFAGAGKVQAADAMTPYLDQLGYDVNNLGSVGGLPVYQLLNRAQEAERAQQEQQARAGGDEMAGLGYPTNERGNLDDPSANRGPLLTDEVQTFGTEGGEGDLDEATADALMPGEADLATSEEFGGGEGVADVSVGRGIGPASLSTGDAFAQALAAHRYAQETGRPARGPDEEDYMGAVPRNVIDLPAMNAQTRARAQGAMDARVGALPAELRPGAKANAEAILGLGFEADAALKEFDTAMQDPVSIYNSQQNLLAQKEKDEQLTRPEKAALRKGGADMVDELYKERGVDKSLNAINKAAEVTRVLDNDNREDDGMVANAVMEAQNLKGAPSNTDLEFAFNIPKGSLLTRGIAIIEEAVRGGMSDAQKAAIKTYMEAVRETQERNLRDYLDNGFDTIDSDDTLDPETRRGFKSKLERSVPATIHNRYWEEREKREGPGGRRRSSAPIDAGDLDPEKLGRVIGKESGGDATATSVAGASGTMQIMPDNLRAMGIEPEEFKKLSPEEQMPYNIRYLKERGITKDSSAEDYAMAVAAPSFIGKPADTVVYPKSDDPESPWAQNPGWRPAGGGDITVGSILKFYGLGGAKKAEAAPAKTTELKMPEPKTPQEKRYLELLAKKRGG